MTTEIIKKKSGGARPGAGRPKGSRNKAVVDRDNLLELTAIQLQAAGMSNSGDLTPADISKMKPVEIIMAAAIKEAIANRWIMAADLAAKAAPYIHARLQHTISDTSVRNVKDMNDEELSALIERLDANSRYDDDSSEGV